MLCLCAEQAEEENRELSANDEELEEEVFRKRKVELTTAGTGALKTYFTVCKIREIKFSQFFCALKTQTVSIYLLDKQNFTVIRQFVLRIASDIETERRTSSSRRPRAKPSPCAFHVCHPHVKA